MVVFISDKINNILNKSIKNNNKFNFYLKIIRRKNYKI